MSEDLAAWADKLQHMKLPELRALMYAENVKAIPGAADQCLLARFLLDKTGERVYVSIHGDPITPIVKAVATLDDGTHSHTFELGEDAGYLARKFDRHEYPELIEREMNAGELAVQIDGKYHA